MINKKAIAYEARLSDYLEVLSLMSGDKVDKDFFGRLIQTDGFRELYEQVNSLTKQAKQPENELKYLNCNGKMYPAVLALCREGIEDTDIGQRIVEMKRKHERRLYAVLSPSVEENLQRIRIVLHYASLILDYEEHQLFVLSLSKYDRAIRIANEFEARMISYTEAVELLDEIFD
jgi:hypothetical protein